MNKIITIGREFGSGGREVGKRLAQRLGIAYYDHEIIVELAKKTDLATDYVRQITERRPEPFFPITVGQSFYPVVNPILDLNNSIYVEQSNIITEMAKKSDCVIVGRCADYVLREMKPLRLFIYAEMDFKMARCRSRAPEQEHLTDKELKQQMQKIDKNRSKYYQFYTGRIWGDKQNYDLCVNTSYISVKDAVDGIAKIFA
ncbi:MAG: cytidylate kinase-like family protein [Sphaerochaetaceae bacterium]|nr:cytidylate kinase-like family protein [Sphaerochaetaceae bacterium]